MRHLASVVGLLAAASCGWLSHAPRPDALARWATENGVQVDPPGTLSGDKGERVGASADGHGYSLSFVDGKSTVSYRLYLVPVSSLDARLGDDLRRVVFPNGVALVPGKGEGAPPPRRVAEGELEGFYVGVMASSRAALCDDFTRPCDGATLVSLVGKLKGTPWLGRQRRALHIDLEAPTVTKTLLGDALGDPQQVCGFDPDRDRVPTHVAVACDRIRLTGWALDHEFTITRSGDLLPLTSGAVKAGLEALLATPLYGRGAPIVTLDEAS